MSKTTDFPAAQFDQAGLNRQHVFDLPPLPAEISKKLGDTTGFRQLILLGHGGKRLWECVQATALTGENPIDDYTVQTIAAVFAQQLAGKRYRIIYPGDTPVGLQQLGKLAGWHHPSPFMVGIDSEWGSWFAYRAAILADTDFLPFLPVDRSSPCPNCVAQPCRSTCPASALTGNNFALDKCIAYRRQADSACQYTCLARISCPAGSEHRYGDAQLHHTYSRSLSMIERYYPSQPGLG